MFQNASKQPFAEALPAFFGVEDDVTEIADRGAIGHHAGNADLVARMIDAEVQRVFQASLDHFHAALGCPVGALEQANNRLELKAVWVIGNGEGVSVPIHVENLAECGAFRQLRLQMRVPYYQVDAFTDRAFSGNPAGVCLLEHWLDDGMLQRIAGENNLSETAFLVSKGDGFELRWFTPVMEVDLCGHATLASAFVLFTELKHAEKHVTFQTKSGPLRAEWKEGVVMLDFPARAGVTCAAPPALMEGLGHIPREVKKSRDFLAVLGDEDDVRGLTPDFPQLATLDCLGVIATARGKDVDFVSRFFAPGAGLNEDPVTGSAHCTLIPYWAEKLGKQTLVARQLSQRGGTIVCEMRGERVGIGGQAVLFSRAELIIPD